MSLEHACSAEQDGASVGEDAYGGRDDDALGVAKNDAPLFSQYRRAPESAVFVNQVSGDVVEVLSGTSAVTS